MVVEGVKDDVSRAGIANSNRRCAIGQVLSKDVGHHAPAFELRSEVIQFNQSHAGMGSR